MKYITHLAAALLLTWGSLAHAERVSSGPSGSAALDDDNHSMMLCLDRDAAGVNHNIFVEVHLQKQLDYTGNKNPFSVTTTEVGTSMTAKGNVAQASSDDVIGFLGSTTGSTCVGGVCSPGNTHLDNMYGFAGWWVYNSAYDGYAAGMTAKCGDLKNFHKFGLSPTSSAINDPAGKQVVICVGDNGDIGTEDIYGSIMFPRKTTYNALPGHAAVEVMATDTGVAAVSKISSAGSMKFMGLLLCYDGSGSAATDIIACNHSTGTTYGYNYLLNQSGNARTAALNYVEGTLGMSAGFAKCGKAVDPY